MKSIFILLFLTLFISTPTGFPTLRDPASDDYIDKVLEKLRQVIAENGLDPAGLPDGEVGFSQTILGITFHGSAKVYNGFFQGLSSIKRNGDTSFTFDPNAEKVTLTANVGLNDAKAGYSARAEFMDIGVSATADVKISKVDVYFSADMCIQDGCTLQLSTFNIKEIGNIDVNIDGLGPLGWILGEVVGLVADLIRDFIADIIEGPIKDLLQDILNDLVPDFPSKIMFV